MKLSSFTKDHRLTGIFRLCVCVLVSCVLALGGMALNAGPVQAQCHWISATPVQLNPIACQFYSYSFQVNATCATSCQVTGYHCNTFVNNVSIHGLYFDSTTGTFSGTPTIAGESWAGLIYLTGGTVGACNSSSIGLNLTITVQPCAMSITSSPGMTQLGQENVPFYMTQVVTGGTGPYSWTTSGLPAGLYLNPSSGAISGTPSQGSAGTYNIQLHVTDTTGCCAPASDSFLLNIAYATYDFTVKIGPGLTAGSTKVLIDGSEEATLGGNEHETFTARVGKSHVVTVDQTVSSPGQSATRFTVKGSTDKTVSEDNDLAYFDYAPAVLIEMNTDPSGVAQLQGAGWHAIGDVFNSSAPSPIDSNSQPGVQYRFKLWKLPDGSTSPNKDLAFTVSTPGTITAVYDTYYLLTLSSDYPPVTETSWYLKGSDATYNLSLQEAPMLGFWGFLGGKLRPMNDSGSHLMDAPFTQQIAWSKDYTIPIIIIVITLLVIAGVVYFAYRRRGVPVTRRRAAPRPAVRTAAKRASSKTVLSKRASSRAKKRAAK
jgi:hypothetical protein